MESADLHHQHHQLQEQLFGSSNSLANTTTTPSFSTTFINNNANWNPNLILISGNLNSNINELLSNSSTHDHSRQNNENILVPTSNSSMIQELGFHDQWTTNNNGGIYNFSNTDHSAHELHFSRIKDGFPSKFSSDLNDTPSNLDHQEFHHFPSTSNFIKEQEANLNNLSEKLPLKSFSSACPLNGLPHHHQVSAGDQDQLYSNNSQNCASFGSGLASSNIENFGQFSPCSSSFSSSMAMNLQTLDLWNPTKFVGCSPQPHPHGNNNLNGVLFKQVHPSSFVLDHHHLQESSHTSSNIINKKSAFMTNNGGRSPSASNSVTETKRSSSSSSSSSDHHQPKSFHHLAAFKKPRTESCSTFPPFKVRKEKLGDRIAALQQLVSPFGKTDTASVLMEAIGYIKFLQDQVETLSGPYMKSTGKMTRTSGQGGSCEIEGSEETKRDLRSRGLCLVPFSCISYIINDINEGGVPTLGWSSDSNFSAEIPWYRLRSQGIETLQKHSSS